MEESDILDRLVRNDLTKKVILKKAFTKNEGRMYSASAKALRKEHAWLLRVCVCDGGLSYMLHKNIK